MLTIFDLLTKNMNIRELAKLFNILAKKRKIYVTVIQKNIAMRNL